MIELIPLSSAKADHYAKLRARLAVQKASEHEAIAAIDELCNDNERLALRSQASVAAALEAAAGKCDAFAAFRQKQLDDDEAKHWRDQDAILKRAWKMSISGLEAAATAIRALINPAQHDALAAHVAAEVAKARAEDAAKIEALETAAKAGAELAAYASYSEIVGAIGHNRPQIREWCDKVFAANHVLRDIEWKALTSTHEATQIGAKP